MKIMTAKEIKAEVKKINAEGKADSIRLVVWEKTEDHGFNKIVDILEYSLNLSFLKSGEPRSFLANHIKYLDGKLVSVESVMPEAYSKH